MAEKKMIVKRLSSIENFGSMDVLCSDKTGTLTEGVVVLKDALDGEGNKSDKTLLYAALNATFQTGYANPIDTMLAKVNLGSKEGWEKVDELAYDFDRRCISILVRKTGDSILITKGAFASVLADCTQVEIGGAVQPIEGQKQKLQELFEKYGNEGFRLIAVACRNLDGSKTINKDSEREMTFLGFLLFFDPLKPEIAATIEKLNKRKVSLKIITGDNRIVATHVAKQLGLSADDVIVGSDPRLIALVNEKDIFAEIRPEQKQEIILALRKSGHIVGYLGDGINDVTALHAADVGISVESAADAAKEAADFVLFRKDLSVLLQGIDEGRRTFANTLKYVFMATSANFGNMFSMAGASLFLPFLPLLPKQILLTNLLTDVPEMTIATDRV
ncbi:MAG TPA: HAD-IC family P-type ATPase, partial [Rhabdochlamydiaceae bacterium]